MTKSNNVITPTSAEIQANYVDNTLDSPGLYGRPLVLNKTFDLLLLMINSLQQTAASQANRLNFLSSWQQAYTDEMNQIHAFVGFNGDGSETTDRGVGGQGVLDDNSQNATNARTGMNTQNTNLTQLMQGNQQVVSDDAKALQTSVNQTNDAVQSQTDMATSILQQLSTILTAIYSNS